MIKNDNTFRYYWYEYIKNNGKTTALELLDYTETYLGISINSKTRQGKLNSIRKSLDLMVIDGEIKKIKGGIYFI